jgi:hypothetical protein
VYSQNLSLNDRNQVSRKRKRLQTGSVIYDHHVDHDKSMHNEGKYLSDTKRFVVEAIIKDVESENAVRKRRRRK